MIRLSSERRICLVILSAELFVCHSERSEESPHLTFARQATPSRVPHSPGSCEEWDVDRR